MSVAETTKHRGSRYGEFRDNSFVTQSLCKAIFKHAEGFDRKYNEAEREGIHMICHKLARIACGRVKVKDNWHDICGYALITKPLITHMAHTGYPEPNALCMDMYLLLQSYRQLEDYEKTAIFGILTMLAMSTVMSNDVLWEGIISYAGAAELLTIDE